MSRRQRVVYKLAWLPSPVLDILWAMAGPPVHISFRQRYPELFDDLLHP